METLAKNVGLIFFGLLLKTRGAFLTAAIFPCFQSIFQEYANWLYTAYSSMAQVKIRR